MDPSHLMSLIAALSKGQGGLGAYQGPSPTGVTLGGQFPKSPSGPPGPLGQSPYAGQGMLGTAPPG